jgi:hypothetical protein
MHAATLGACRETRTTALCLESLPVVVIVAVCYAGVALLFNRVQSVSNSLNGIDQGFEQLGQAMEIGGTTADAAASVAASRPPDSLSASSLDVELPKYQWLDGATAVPSSSLKRPIVGVNIVGTDTESAVQIAPGLCSFGLSVTSSSDPLIAEDHLLGPGTYYKYVFQTSQCIADQAPSSGWASWSNRLP